MAQGFIIGMVALGGALALLQRERATIAQTGSIRANPIKHASGGVTIAQEPTPAPVDPGVFGPVMGQSSDDGTMAGNTSCSPSSPTVNAAGIGATNPTSGPPSIMADMTTFQPPSTMNGDSSTAPSDSTVRGQSAPEVDPVVIPRMPATSYAEYLNAITYGIGQRVTRREESENLQTVGPSVGAIW